MSRLENIARRIRNCRRCPLFKSALNAVPGEGSSHARIFFIGISPGSTEDKTGRPFSGRAGKFLDSVFKRLKIDRKKVFITSLVKHHPPNNRVPFKREVLACKPFLLEQLKVVNPEVVVVFGRVAQHYLKGEPVLSDKQVINVVHPAAAMRFPNMRKRFFREISVIKKKA